MNAWLLLIPLISAFSCWSVIKLFFIILFRPKRPIPFLGLKIQGILPAQQPSIAGQMGKAVAGHFLTSEMISSKITDPSQMQKIMPVIGEHIDDFLRNKLKKEMPIVSMFIGDKTINSLRGIFMTELEKLFPQIIQRFVSNIINDLDIEELVAQRINEVPMSTVEQALRRNLSKQLTLAATAAAFFGFIIGLAEMIIIHYTT